MRAMGLKLLRQSPLLRSLPSSRLRQVMRFAHRRAFAAGDTIFNKRDLAQHMFIVASGRVKIYTRSGLRKTKTFAYLGSGDFFGEMALLDARERSASAVASAPSELIVIHKRDFKRFLLADSDLCFNLLRALSDRLRKANEQIESLLFQNILGRVARTLCELARRDPERGKTGVTIRHPYTQRELAELVGTTREPLARALGVLRRGRFIELRDGRILIRSAQKLESLSTAPLGVE